MVDAIVSFAINRLGDYIIQEAKILGEVSRKLEWLRYELNWMHAFVTDAEKKQDEGQRIRMWVSEIREVAFDTEDVIDTYILKVKGVGIAKKGLLTSTKKFFSVSSKADQYDIGQKLEELITRINGLPNKRNVYGISNIDGAEGETNSELDKLQSLRKAASEEEEDDVVGFENDISSLEAELIDNERRVISILGMGGLGKTTLAKKLYNNNKSTFHCHAWVCVSQVWGIKDLLQKLFNDLRMPLSRDELIEMSDNNMRRRLHEHLKGQPYLLVLDDVWDRNVWESLRSALPDDNNGSKIIITTRIQGVAEVPNERTYLHRLRGLQEMQSCQLFCKKVFPNHNGEFHCPPNTENLGREMVAKCGGLPLAISVLGEVLQRKERHEWPSVKDHIWRELKNESIHIRWLFELSYRHLTQELKPCILYLALFPEDFVIDAEKLIRLWVAEGILPPNGPLDPEELAGDFLNKLVSSSMIQVEKINWRTIATCRVHDLLRDLAVNKARELSLLHVSDKIKSDPSLMASSYRKLGLRSGFKWYLDHSKPCVRTLLFFNSEINNSRSVTKFKLLRVLDLKEIKFCLEGKNRLPEAVGELIHLRYLGLKDTNTDELRQAIGKLEFLQTLDASSRLKMTLPSEICNLKQLRHLRGNFSVMPPMLCQELTNLQTLKIVEISDSRTQEGGESNLNPIAQLTNLKFVSVRSFVDMQLSIQPLFRCQHLLELRVHGRIANLPVQMHESLPNLRYLELRDSKLEQDPMPTLEMLQKLMVLELSSIGIDIVTCTARGFHHLQVLRLSEVEMQVVEGAQPMPNLRALSMSDSAKLTLPERLRSLPAVDHLNWEWENIWQENH